MRRLLAVIVVAVVSVIVDYSLMLASSFVPALPPAQMANWITLLDGACASRLQMQVISAGVQWYGGPVLIGLSASIVSLVARMMRAEWWTILAGAAAFAIVEGVLGAVLNASSLFSLFFAVICAAGGAAISDRILASRLPAASSVPTVSAPEQP